MFLFFPIYLMMRCLESLKAFSNFKSPFGNHVYTEWSFWKRKKNIKDFLNMVLCLRFSIRKISIRISPFLSLVPYFFTFAHLAWPRFSPKKIHFKIPPFSCFFNFRSQCAASQACVLTVKQLGVDQTDGVWLPLRQWFPKTLSIYIGLHVQSPALGFLRCVSW